MRNETEPEHQNDVVVANHNYALNGKIMLCSVIFIFAAFLAAFCFHSRRRNRRRNFHGDGDSAAAAPEGLDPSVLENLPAFDHSSAAHGGAVLKCAVCLSEFRNDEAGRVLPKCEHAFHARCIDTWLRSRSNCPLCRAPVRSGIPVQVHAIVVVREPAEKVAEPVTGLCRTISEDEHGSVNV